MVDVKGAFVFTTAAYITPIKTEAEDVIGHELEKAGFSKVDKLDETTESWQKTFSIPEQENILVTISASKPSSALMNTKLAPDKLTARWVAHAQFSLSHQETDKDQSLHLKALNAELRSVFTIQGIDSFNQYSSNPALR